MESNMGMKGTLNAAKIPAGRPHRARSFRIPGYGRLILTRDPGVSTRLAQEYLQTNLSAVHLDGDGKVKDKRDFGSGTVTNVGCLSLCNDWNWSSPSGAAINTIKLANYHAVGTAGSVASAITQIALNALTSPTTTTAVTGTQSLVAGTTGGDAASVSLYKSIATTNFTGSAAITEWGLFSAAPLSATTGSPFTNGATATSASVTGTPFTASSSTVQGQQTFVFQDTTAGSPFWGLCTSNTSGTINVPAWYVTSTGGVSGVNPIFGDAYQILPTMFDRQTFLALNVVNGDSIIWTFSLQIVPGG